MARILDQSTMRDRPRAGDLPFGNRGFDCARDEQSAVTAWFVGALTEPRIEPQAAGSSGQDAGV